FSGKCLKKRRENKRLSQSEIANQLGINRSSYSSWESGRSKPNQKNLLLLSEILDVEPSYFESEYHIVTNYLQLNENNQVLADEFMENLLAEQVKKEAKIKVRPLFSVRVLKEVPLSAGLGDNYYDEYESETVYSEKSYNYDIAAYIHGDSMMPKYSDGEVALINETGFDYSGEVYAIYLNGQTFIKKVYKEADHYRIVSINDDYPDKYAYSEDEFRIVGKVIGHFMPVVGR
ncbi:TPA: helix-turn-helix transcriptional regulator, partial [Streptococcus suis]|nr:helix-turn-helix transcriptional regulator [Streptococcus suis]